MEFEKLFIESNGKPIIYNGKELKMLDRLQLSSKEVKLKINILFKNSQWNQGIVLQTKGYFKINGQKFNNKIIIWEHTAPKEILLNIQSEDKLILIYNVWETSDTAIHYWHNGAAMYIEDLNDERVYHCNDGQPNDDFNDLIFKIVCYG